VKADGEKESKASGTRVFWTGAAVAFLALNAGICAWVAGRGGSSAEAIIQASLAADLFGGTSRGYHALIGAFPAPPMPALATVPFLHFERLASGFAFYPLLSGLSLGIVLMAGALAGLAGKGRRWGWLIGGAIMLIPGNPVAAWTGRLETGGVFFVLALAAYLGRWIRGRRLRNLAALANVLALATLWDVRFLPVGLTLIGWVAGLERRRTDIGRRRALLLVLLVPCIYVCGVWILFNWLVFGNPLRLFEVLPVEYWREFGFWTILAAGLGLAGYFFAKRGGWRLAVAVALGGVVAMAAGARHSSWTERAISGERLDGNSQREEAFVEDYLRRNRGGWLILVVGRPGYLVARRLESALRVVHRLDLRQIDPILEDTRGRPVAAVLEAAQADLWRAELGGYFWARRFLEDPLYRREAAVVLGREPAWRVYTCIRPFEVESEVEQ